MPDDSPKPIDHLHEVGPDVEPLPELTPAEARALAYAEGKVGTFHPLPGLPGPTRASCAGVPRPCPYVRCTAHLYTRAAQDKPGKPRLGNIPTPQLEAGWLVEGRASCLWDVVEANPAGMGGRDVARAMGTSTRLIEQIVVAARAAREATRVEDLEDEYESREMPLDPIGSWRSR